MGQLAAQERRGLHAVGYGRPQVKEDQVAATFRRFLDRGRAIVYCAAYFVGGCGFYKIANSAAHGGTFVHNEQSRPARAGHTRESYYGWLPKTIRKCVLFRLEVLSSNHEGSVSKAGSGEGFLQRSPLEKLRIGSVSPPRRVRLSPGWWRAWKA